MQSQLAPEQAKALFDAGGFFILPLEAPGQEFGIDGSVWAVKRFAGIKFLPPGLHLFLYSSPPAQSSTSSQPVPPTPFGNTFTIRRGILRFTKAREVVVRKWDDSIEDVVAVFKPLSLPSSSVAELEVDHNDENAISKRRRTSITSADETSIRASTSTSLSPATARPQTPQTLTHDQLRTLDPQLAPYPFEGHKQWKELTSLITQKTLDTVLGVDAMGDSRADALMSSKTDELIASRSNAGRATIDSARTVWGKPRESSDGNIRESNAIPESTEDVSHDKNELDESQSGVPAEAGSISDDQPTERILSFPVFDLKRSWREGASGEELSTNSRDKSWLLGAVIQQQLNGDALQLLGNMQLAFILVTQLHNFSALDAYKSLLSLLCRSTSILSPESSTKNTSLSLEHVLSLYHALLRQVLYVHLEHLRAEFFAEDLPDFDAFILDEMVNLRCALRSAIRSYSIGHLSSSAQGHIEEIKQAWSRVQSLVNSKFGWHLESLQPSTTRYAPEADLAASRGTRTAQYNLLATPDDDDEYVEEGDDAPVIVEM